MYLASTMTRDPLCLHPEMTLLQALEVAADRCVRHFPVTDAAGRILGMISDRDLRSALPSTTLSPPQRHEELGRLGEVPVGKVMSRPPVTLPREATLDDALLVFDRRRIGAIAVVDHGGVLVGIVTVRDVLAAYRRLFGIGAAGSSLIEVRDDGRPGLLSRIAAALEGAGIACPRLVQTGGEGGEPATVFARVQTYNLHEVHAVLRDAGLAPVERKPGAAAP